MQNSLRLWLSLILCGLSLLSSGGASEALHQNLHSLLSSECSDSVVVAPALGPLTVSAAPDVCPLETILKSALGQSFVLPTHSLSALILPIAPEAFAIFSAIGVESWNASWTFSRGPPANA